MKKLINVLSIGLLSTIKLHSYESMQTKTPVGEIKVIQLPQRVALEARSQTSYFRADNGLFRKLFKYIDSNDISMTTPVEAEINPGKMRFFVGQRDQSKKFESTEEICVKKIPSLLVLAIGMRGGYTENRFRENEKKLNLWIAENPRYQVAGQAYAVYWHGPFVPSFLKRSEVHLPIMINAEEKNSETKRNY